jgi:hypothetical protein
MCCWLRPLAKLKFCCHLRYGLYWLCPRRGRFAKANRILLKAAELYCAGTCWFYSSTPCGCVFLSPRAPHSGGEGKNIDILIQAYFRISEVCRSRLYYCFIHENLSGFKKKNQVCQERNFILTKNGNFWDARSPGKKMTSMSFFYLGVFTV